MVDSVPALRLIIHVIIYDLLLVRISNWPLSVSASPLAQSQSYKFTDECMEMVGNYIYFFLIF
jgi:hypothetical protein